ncbi:hypothetical protein ACQ4N7_24860, partial [Nodosilinea sp. AN01ver1]|uniref:hypothetical protein n=1 Tax=Nodosilinea sp. AN01ver1 TaxID=3423362 RepID=UPI003D31B197
SLITAILNPLWRLGNSMSSAPIESSSKYTRTAMALISFVSQPDFRLDAILADPLGTIGLIIWNGVLAVLLAFGDEILFRLRDRIAIGAQKNQQLAKIRAIQLDAHDTLLNHYKTRAMEQAEAAGQNLTVAFDWLEGGNNV